MIQSSLFSNSHSIKNFQSYPNFNRPVNRTSIQQNKKKQIVDVIQQYNHRDNQQFDIQNQHIQNIQIDTRTQKNYLNQLYNNDIAPEDSEKTLFYYLKTLTYQVIIVIFTFLSIFIALMMIFDALPTLSRTEARRALMFLSGLTIITAVMEKQTRIKWLKQKKQKQSSAFDQYISLFMQILCIIPCPNVFMENNITILDQLGTQVHYSWDQLLTLALLGRVIYFYRFIIHIQLYYGSRPDRLSRLYTVKFGTFNAFKFLINQKPFLIVIMMFTVNVIFLPLILLLIQGNINANLGSFMDCIHFCVVTQVTVGYGNIKVVTIFGRIVSIFCVLIGVTSTSLLLIFFMRLMEQSSQQEQAHILLSSLEKRQSIAKARVLRIQAEYLHSKIHCAPQQKLKYEQKVRRFRFQNRRNIIFQRQQPANVKRMMLSNFSAVIQMINQLKQKQSILSKLIQFTIKTQNTNDHPKKKQKNKTIASESESSDFWSEQKQDPNKFFENKPRRRQSIYKVLQRNQIKKKSLLQYNQNNQ